MVPLPDRLNEEQITKVDAAVTSEPGVGSQAYCMVLVRLKDKANGDEIAEAMLDGIDMHKWVCVAADKASVATFDDKVLFVMADSELVDVDADDGCRQSPWCDFWLQYEQGIR